ncbi:MAG: YncE family protein [Nitrososphaera sp.]
MLIIVLGIFSSFVSVHQASALTIIDPYEGFPCRNVCEIDLETDNWTFPIYYWLYGEKDGDRDGIKLTGIAIDVRNKAVSIGIYTNQGAVLVIPIPNGLLQSSENNLDTPFRVLSDGNELKYETSNESMFSDEAGNDAVTELTGLHLGEFAPEKTRSLKIPIARDTNHIDIIGTYVSELLETMPTPIGSYECQSIQDGCSHTFKHDGNDTEVVITIPYAMTDPIDSQTKYSEPPARIVEVYLTTNKYMPLKEMVIEMETRREGSLSLILPNTIARSEQSSSIGNSMNVTMYKDFKVYYEGCYDYCIIAHETIIGDDKRLLRFEFGNGTREITVNADWVLGQPDYKMWEPDECEVEACGYNIVTQDNQTYSLYYRLKSFRDVNAPDNPRVERMYFDLDKKSLVVELDATHKGLAGLELYLPDEVIVSLDEEGKNSRPYTVFIDGQLGTEWQGLSVETGTIEGNVLDSGGYGLITIREGEVKEFRPIEIMFYSGTEKIEVIGTRVVPELAIVDNIPIGDKEKGYSPFGVVMNQAANTVYATSPDSNTVAVINASTNELTDTISVGNLPVEIAINQNTGFVYVANGNSGTVSVIDGSTNKIEEILNVTEGTGFYNIGGIAVNERTNNVYILVNNELAEPPYASIVVIDGMTNRIAQTFKVADLRVDYDVGDSARGIAVNSKTNTIYVTMIFGSLHIIDGSSNKVLTSLAVGRMPTEVEVNEQTNRLYISDFGSQLLFVLDASTNRIIETVWVGVDPQGIAVDGMTNTIYVAGPGLTVINGSSNEVEKRIKIGGFPVGVAFNPNNNSVYVAGWQSDSIFVINAGYEESSGSMLSLSPLRQNTTSGKYIVELGSEFTNEDNVTLLLSFFDGSGTPLDYVEYDLVVRNASDGGIIQQLTDQVMYGVGRHDIGYENDQGIQIDVMIKADGQERREKVTFEIVIVPEFGPAALAGMAVALIIGVIAVARYGTLRKKD